MANVKCIYDFYYYQLKHFPKNDAFTQKENGKWTSLSTKDFIDKARDFSLGLLKLGIRPGDKIAMITNNRTEWHLTDLAVQQIGVTNVPIYPTITPEDYAYILNDCEAKLIFVSNDEIWDKVKQIKDQVPSLQHFYSYDKVEGVKHYTEILSLDAGGDISVIEDIQKNINEDSLATMIYTSGTTGKPKGVMLSHKNLVSNVLASESRLPKENTDRALSFLPLCHVFERMIDYLYIYQGKSLYYAESIDALSDNLKEVKPHLFATVPRLLEKVYDKIVTKGSELSGIKKSLFFWALDLGLKYDPNENMGWWYNTQLKLANKIIFSKWREALGNEVVAIVSGGAALQPRLARVFMAAGIPVLEGYGLTETSPVIAVNSLNPGGLMIGTVGRPLENLEVKIADDGEICVKGPSVMLGYYKLPEKTKEVIDDEGFFHTGDIGTLVNGQYLKITDRKKEIFKTSGGKYIAPQVMENKFKESRFIEQIMVIGEGEKMPAAFVQPDFEFVKDWCKRKNINCGQTTAEIAANEQVKERIAKEIEDINKSFAKYEQVKQFEIVPDVWSIEGGQLTPTLKLKRRNILKQYQDLYEKIYGHRIE